MMNGITTVRSDPRKVSEFVMEVENKAQETTL